MSMCRFQNNNKVTTSLKKIKRQALTFASNFEEMHTACSFFKMLFFCLQHVTLSWESVCAPSRIQQESLSWSRLWAMGHMDRCTRWDVMPCHIWMVSVLVWRWKHLTPKSSLVTGWSASTKTTVMPAPLLKVLWINVPNYSTSIVVS